jgi:hypothetical protein
MTRAALLLVLLLVCGWYRPSSAAVAFDATGTAACDGATSPVACSTLTIGSGSNRALVVLVDFGGSAVAPAVAVTWGGTALVSLGTQFSTGQTIGTALLCLAAPASGNQILSATVTGVGVTEIHVIGVSFTGANQTTPCQNFTSATDQTATTASLTVTSATGDQVVAVQAQSNVGVNSVNNNQVVIDNNGPAITLSGNYANGASTVAMTATGSGSTIWQTSGVDVAAAGGGAPAPTPTQLLMGIGQ